MDAIRDKARRLGASEVHISSGHVRVAFEGFSPEGVRLGQAEVTYPPKGAPKLATFESVPGEEGGKWARETAAAIHALFEMIPD